MASTTEGKRPLSPHLTIYRLPLTAKMSIFHRATGCCMALTLALIVWWLLGAAIGPEAFAAPDWLLTSWLGALFLIGSAFAFFYHLCNGVRHLVWDIGLGFGLETSHTSGVIVLAAAGALTLFTVALAFF